MAQKKKFTEIDAEDLKKWRASFGWTQAEAARQLGMTRDHYSRIEAGGERNGKPYPITRTMMLAAFALEHLEFTRLPE